MRKKLVILSLSLLFLLFSLEANDSPYDLTIYPTADNSVMGVLGDKLGLDMTGYMFIGEGTERGLYFRVGVQTPFDTILGYLNLFNNEISTQNKTNSEEPMKTLMAATRRRLMRRRNSAFSFVAPTRKP